MRLRTIFNSKKVKTVKLWKIGEGSEIMRSAGFPNSIFIPYNSSLKPNHVYAGSAKGVGLLVCVMDYCGQKTIEVLWDSPREIPNGIVGKVNMEPLRAIAPFSKMNYQPAEKKAVTMNMPKAVTITRPVERVKRSPSPELKVRERTTPSPESSSESIVLEQKSSSSTSPIRMDRPDAVDRLKNVIKAVVRGGEQKIQITLKNVEKSTGIFVNAGFEKARFITFVTSLGANCLYKGVVRGGAEILMAIVVHDGAKYTEVMMVNNSDIIANDVVFMNTKPLRKIANPAPKIKSQSFNLSKPVSKPCTKKMIDLQVGSVAPQGAFSKKISKNVSNPESDLDGEVSAIRLDVENVRYLAAPEHTKKIRLTKCRTGTALMKAAGFNHSRLIPNMSGLPVNFAYFGVAKRKGKSVRVLIYVRSNMGRKTTEIALVDGSRFLKGDVIEFDTKNPIRFLKSSVTNSKNN
eukprot:UN29881